MLVESCVSLQDLLVSLLHPFVGPTAWSHHMADCLNRPRYSGAFHLIRLGRQGQSQVSQSGKTICKWQLRLDDGCILPTRSKHYHAQTKSTNIACGTRADHRILHHYICHSLTLYRNKNKDFFC